MRVTSTQLLTVAAVALVVLSFTYWMTSRPSTKGWRRDPDPAFEASARDAVRQASDPVTAQSRQREIELKKRSTLDSFRSPNNNPSAAASLGSSLAVIPGAGARNAGGASVLRERRTAIARAGSGKPGRTRVTTTLNPTPPPAPVAIAPVIRREPAAQSAPVQLTPEEEARAKLLSDYRAYETEKAELLAAGKFVEPKFCVNNPLCDDSRRDRDMYERRHKRMNHPEFQKGWATRDCPADRPITIHLEHKIKSWWSHVTDPMIATFDACPVKCAISDSPQTADILYSMVNPMHKMGGTHQKTAIVSLESFKGHEGENINEAIANSADIVVSYSRMADIWVNYWYGLTGDNYNNCATAAECLDPEFPPNLFMKHKLHPTGALSPLFVSNCHSGRGNYLQELMKYVKIDSYGGCFTTPGLPRAEQGRIPKQKLSREYKFHLAFENSILDDYVTEKLWDAWSYGAIPVYWGAPNVEAYAPGPHSFINALDFAGPKELGAYLTAVSLNNTAYLEYFEWRKQKPHAPGSGPFSKSFMAMSDNNFTNRGKHSMLCKLCTTYHKRYCNKA